MGFLDKALKTGKDLLAKNADKVDTVIDKAGDVVDKRTHGKYAGTVNKVQDAARKAAAKANEEKANDQQAHGGTTPPPPATPQTPPNPPVPPPSPTPPSPPVPPTTPN